MKKFIYPIFKKCKPLPACKPTGDPHFPHRLEIDLKNACHRGYINWRSVPPKPGTNPFLADYENILDDTDDLRLIEPGLGNDSDSRKAESSKFGRCMAVGLLNEHYGYHWFANISNLRNAPDKGWSARKKNDGDAPDMLVTDGGNDFAVAEAKARKTPIKLNSQETKNWRTQVQNIVIEKDGDAVSFPTWLIATRYVVGDSKDKPQMLIEDPPTEGRSITDNDGGSLVRWIAKSHVAANLNRLGMYDVSLRIQEPLTPTRTRVTWKCTHPRLQQFTFVGKPGPGPGEGPLPITWWRPDDPDDLVAYFQLIFRNFYQDGFFDGIEVTSIQDLIRGASPSALTPSEYNLDPYPHISLLSDGSFIAPMNLMYPSGTIEL